MGRLRLPPSISALLIVGFLAFFVAIEPLHASPAGKAPPPDHECARDLETGRDAAWLAKLGQARDAFRAAAEHAPCRLDALIGLAEIERRRDKDKAAVEAATAAIEEARATGAREDQLVEALFQLGRAVEEQGWRRNEARQRLAEDVLREAVDLSGGDHREAVRALQRLYGDTGRDEALAEVREENPDVVAMTRVERKRLVRPRPRPRALAAADAFESSAGALFNLAAEWAPPEGTDDALWRHEQGVTWPRRTSPAAAFDVELPHDGKATEFEGALAAMVLVDLEGEVRDVQALNELPLGYTDTALEVIHQLKFRPARDGNNETRAAWLPVVVRFTPPDSSISVLTANLTLRDEPKPVDEVIDDLTHGRVPHRVVVARGFSEPLTRPEKLAAPPPRYTDDARAERIEGVVVVQALIDEFGRTHPIDIVEGLPLGLTEEALMAVATWRFEPAKDVDGNPQTILYNLTLNFQLQ